MLGLIFWIIAGFIYFKIALSIAFDSGVTGLAAFMMAIVLGFMLQPLMITYNRTIDSIGRLGAEAAKEFLKLTNRKFIPYWIASGITDRVIVLIFSTDLDGEMGSPIGEGFISFLVFKAILVVPFYAHHIISYSSVKNY